MSKGEEKTTHKRNTNDFKTLNKHFTALIRNESMDLTYPVVSVNNESGHLTRTVIFFFS